MPRQATQTPPVIGLLGAIAAGKSAVAARLAQLGATVLDADREVGGLLADPAVIEQIARAVAPRAVRDGALDRRALADAVFADPAKRAALEAILHPPVIDAARALIARPPAGAEAVVIDAPLLLEAGMDALCDELWYVGAPREQRLRRAVEHRGWDPGELDRRERAQIPPEEKRRRAHRVITNEADPTALRDAVDRAWNDLLHSRG